MYLTMRKRWTRWSVLGHEVIDGSRRHAVGQVVDTYPFDGGEVELVVVRLDGAFGGKRMLAVEDLWSDGSSGCARRSPPGRSRTPRS